jgi:hypothetical protein
MRKELDCHRDTEATEETKELPEGGRNPVAEGVLEKVRRIVIK